MRPPEPGTNRGASLDYRPDIDGLRAVAVLPVLFFHAGFAGFAGGFVGVDVFFVISGFLITSLIVADVQRGCFSIAAFYERRIRRIFPALFVVVAVVSILAVAYLFPEQLEYYGKSVAATAAFASNLLFWTEIGYFAPGADEKPLLHTWSLAVEEQFYVLFPIYVVLVYRYAARHLTTLTGALAIGSFGLSAWLVSTHPNAAFYLAPARAWELLLGSLLALAGPSRIPVFPPMRDALSLAGIVMIGWSVCAFSTDTAFPGASALLPCFGAAFVIYGGQGRTSLAGQLLTQRPLVYVGRISYSLYLWHFPMLFFARYLAIRELTPLETGWVLAVSFLLAAFSQRFIEAPFRGRRGLGSRTTIFAAGAAAMGSAVAVASLIYVGDGLPGRLEPAVLEIASVRQDNRSARMHCSFLTPEAVRAGEACEIGARDAEPSFAVWGDSHADMYLSTIDEVAARNDASGLFFSRAGCVSLLGVSQTRPRYDRVCLDFGREVQTVLANSPGIEDVVLISRWAIYGVGERYGPEAGATVFIHDAQSVGRSVAENRATFARGLERTLSALQAMGRRAVLLAQVPEVGWAVPTVLARMRLTGRSFDIAPKRAEYEARQAFFTETVRELRSRYDFVVLYPHEWLCEGQNCAVELAGEPLYYDNSHLSRFGARRVAGVFQPLFDGAAPVVQRR